MMNPTYAIKKFVKDVCDPYFWYVSKQELCKLLEQFPDPNAEEILRICNSYQGAGWYKKLSHLQIESEFLNLVNFVDNLSPNVTVEIGSFMGVTLLAWVKTTKDIVISIDIPESYSSQRQKLFKIFNHPHNLPKIISLLSDSQKISTVEKVKRILSDKPIDVLFIDGDHSYSGVKRDFELWFPLVRSGGVVIFHDIVEMKNSDYGVHLFWEELKQRFTITEIVADSLQNGFGIGIIHVP